MMMMMMVVSTVGLHCIKLLQVGLSKHKSFITSYAVPYNVVPYHVITQMLQMLYVFINILFLATFYY